MDSESAGFMVSILRSNVTYHWLADPVGHRIQMEDAGMDPMPRPCLVVLVGAGAVRVRPVDLAPGAAPDLVRLEQHHQP